MLYIVKLCIYVENQKTSAVLFVDFSIETSIETEAFGRVEKGGRARAHVLAEFARGVVKKWRLNDRSGIGNTREEPWKNHGKPWKNHGKPWVSKWCIASK